MYTFSILLLALSALSALVSALPAGPTGTVCLSTSGFAISGFSTFTPDAGNPTLPSSTSNSPTTPTPQAQRNAHMSETSILKQPLLAMMETMSSSGMEVFSQSALSIFLVRLIPLARPQLLATSSSACSAILVLRRCQMELVPCARLPAPS
jgi:hypothetical protein